MFIVLVWLASIAATGLIAKRKNRDVSVLLILSLFFGPLMVLIALLLPDLQKGSTGVEPEVPVSFSLRDELSVLKEEFRQLGQKIEALEVKLGAYCQEETKEPEPEPVAEPVPVVVAAAGAQPQEATRQDMEMNLGKFWLNKIGIIIFTLGIGFLVTYAFKYFGPALRIISGYLVSIALFIAGTKLERKEKLVYYARVLLGGAWALAYFTTYAMHHFEASRVLASQLADLVLLAAVALGMVWYSLRYRSKIITATALFIGYLTSTLGDINTFTLASAGVLSVAALAVIWKMRWVRLIFLGIACAYATHLAWVVKHIAFSLVPVGELNVENVYFLLDFGFLSLYWLLFSAAVHMIIRPEDEVKLALADFSNWVLYAVFVLPKIHFFYPDQQFNFLLGMGGVYLLLGGWTELAGRGRLAFTDLLIAVASLTFAVALKFIPYHATIIWFVELPFLLLVGLIFNRAVYRYCGLILAVFLLMRFLSCEYDALVRALATIGAVSLSLCYVLYSVWRDQAPPAESLFARRFCAWAALYLAVRLLLVIPDPLWVAAAVLLLAVAVLVAGVVLKDVSLRIYSLGVLAVAAVKFLFETYAGVSEAVQAVSIISKLALFSCYYLLYRFFVLRRKIGEAVDLVNARWLFILVASLFVYTIFARVVYCWITASLEAVVLFSLWWGSRLQSRSIRYYALAVFAAAVIRYFFIDYHSGFVPSLFLGGVVMQLALAFSVFAFSFHQRRGGRLAEEEVFLPDILFYVCAAMVFHAVLLRIAGPWIAMSLGIVGLVFFWLGFIFKDKVFRLGGFIAFAITLSRIVLVDLSRLPVFYKIVSFIAIGMVFLAVSLFYNMEGQAKHK